ncbi:hypothetical protein [Pyruvatibacter mobilis]|uniref:hypothetical protein n=1 Tax=Pyruvatibacter mobilis TaxID=1712261 RepID=UPI003D127CF3
MTDEMDGESGEPNKAASSPKMDEEIIKIWERAVQTQMHFNEMSVRSRQLGLAFVAAALGLALASLGQGKDFALVFSLCGNQIVLHAAALIILGAIMGVLAVSSLDIGVYHQMLRGAVAFGEDIEARFMTPTYGFELGMAQAISHFSRTKKPTATLAGGGMTYGGKTGMSAGKKLKRFYGFLIVALLVMLLAICVVTNLMSLSPMP